jgi:hypothetical protein
MIYTTLCPDNLYPQDIIILKLLPFLTNQQNSTRN